MTDPLLAMLQQVGLKITPFSPASRYYGVETATLEVPNQHPVAYVRRRIIPPADQFSLLQLHTIVQGERPDLIAYQYLGDPERFWQICDANAVLNPGELTEELGKRIRITLPQGIPGNNA